MPGEVLVASEAFSTDVLGYPRAVSKGETFREGHAICEAHPGSFEAWTIDNDVEQATAAPGEKRARRPRADKAESTEVKDVEASKAETGKTENQGGQ